MDAADCRSKTSCGHRWGNAHTAPRLHLLTRGRICSRSFPRAWRASYAHRTHPSQSVSTRRFYTRFATPPRTFALTPPHASHKVSRVRPLSGKPSRGRTSSEIILGKEPVTYE